LRVIAPGRPASCHSKERSIVDSTKETEPMKYALLIYAAERDFAAMSKEEQGRVYNDYMAYTIPTDGPFADTKEQGRPWSLISRT
jgi:hypothetical protein